MSGGEAKFSFRKKRHPHPELPCSSDTATDTFDAYNLCAFPRHRALEMASVGVALLYGVQDP